MKELIEALTIFMNYDEGSSTHCEHDVLLVVSVTEDQVSDEDKSRLEELSFRWMTEYDSWGSYRFGSC